MGSFGKKAYLQRPASPASLIWPGFQRSVAPKSNRFPARLSRLPGSRLTRFQKF
jgi:hypothetical protein